LDGTPFTIRSSRTYKNTAKQVFWLGDQPEEAGLPTGVFKIPGSGRRMALNFLRPPSQRRDRPGVAPGSGLPGSLRFGTSLSFGAQVVNKGNQGDFL